MSYRYIVPADLVNAPVFPVSQALCEREWSALPPDADIGSARSPAHCPFAELANRYENPRPVGRWIIASDHADYTYRRGKQVRTVTYRYAPWHAHLLTLFDGTNHRLGPAPVLAADGLTKLALCRAEEAQP